MSRSTWKNEKSGDAIVQGYWMVPTCEKQFEPFKQMRVCFDLLSKSLELNKYQQIETYTVQVPVANFPKGTKSYTWNPVGIRKLTSSRFFAA